MSKIILGYQNEAWEKSGRKRPIIWNTDKTPHLLISGITGGGKTILSQTIALKILEEHKEIFVCDFKSGGDWDGIFCKYAEYKDCDILVNEFYDLFVETIRKKEKRDCYLLFDEFSSYSLSKDSKEFKSLMEKISHLAFMSRSFGFHLLLISQQFNSKVIDCAIREQFGIKVYMGSTISTESATMLFPNCSIDKSVHLPPCCGYISTQEKELEVIRVPYIQNPTKLKQLLEKNGKSYFN